MRGGYFGGSNQVMAAGVANPEIARRFPDLHPPFASQEAAVEASRCLYCFDAPCTAACPTHIDVPGFIKKIASGNLRGSALTILDANILGASCARVCPVDVLCEGSCVMHRYSRRPIEIGRLQRFAMDSFAAGAALPKTDPVPDPIRVACIGAGPASLACAAELTRRGHSATVFDARPIAGGLNTHGVAEYKLRAADALGEVAFVQSLGVEIRCGENVDAARLREIANGYDAVFLGMGLGKMESLGIPGEDLEGVVDALRFIADYKTAQTIPVGRSVVVVGAGNTAIDAANATRRLGAEDVRVLYRRTDREMPAFAFEYEHAKKEGAGFHWLVKPVRITGTHGRVAAIECVRVTPDLETISGSEFTIFCELVILAIGQSRSLELLSGVGGIETRRGMIAVDRATGRTGNPKFYAGGDIVNGGREVVDAVADGKRAALGILSQLRPSHA
jgi:glutamate synthase (NADPH/NADH) small chain